MSWLELSPTDPFGVATLPYGVIRPAGGAAQPAVRIGDRALPASCAIGPAGVGRRPAQHRPETGR